ncbi:MAG TPA: hypothetical protein VGZ23_05185 [bacterium]|nr:hypothetical protein [bacterium]
MVWDVVNQAGFSAVAKGLPDFLEAALASKLGPDEIAAQLADRFVHVNVAPAGAKPGLLGELEGFLTARLSTAAGDMEAVGMDLLSRAAAALRHDVAHALGADGPLPSVVAAAGEQYASLTLDTNWPIAAPAGASGPALGVPGAAAALQKRLVVADLTPLHTSREPVAWPGRDHYSDIYAPEIYRLVAGFTLR